MSTSLLSLLDTVKELSSWGVAIVRKVCMKAESGSCVSKVVGINLCQNLEIVSIVSPLNEGLKIFFGYV